MEEITKINFPDRSKLTSLVKYHKEGGELIKGMDLIAERNFRAELKHAKLISWELKTIPYDLSGNGKYACSTAVLEIDGKNMAWPFSMIYIDLNQK